MGVCQDARRIRLPGGASGNSWIAPGAVRGGLRHKNSGRARTISPFVESKLKVLVRLHSSHNQKNTEALLGIAPRMLSGKSRQDTEGDLASTVCRVPFAGKVPSTTGSRTFQPLTEPSSHKHLPCCMTCSLLYRARSPRRDEELRGTTANDRDPARSSNSGSRSPSVSLPLNLFPFNGRSRALPRNERCTQFGRATWRGAMMGEGIYHTRKPRATHYSTLYECRVAYRFQSRLSIGPGPDNCPGDC